MSRDPYLKIVNVNENAQWLIGLNLLRYAGKVIDWLQQGDRQSRQGQ
jgi:hypothetical protein